MTEPSWDGALGRLRRAQEDGLQAYEDAACRRVLTLLGRTELAGPIAREGADRTGGPPRCRFGVLAGFLPELPIRFGVGRLLYLKRLAVPDLFDRFTRTPIFRALEGLAEELDPAEGPIALCFRWAAESVLEGKDGAEVKKGIKGGKFMCIHTWPSSPQPNATRILREAPLGGARSEVVIESLEALLASVAPAGAP